MILKRHPLSLRLRLFLSFVAVALVMVGLSVVALRNSWQIRRQATDLTSITLARFERDRTVGRALEIEVDRSADGHWVAGEIEVLGGGRRPKLRGPLDAVDLATASVVLFGQAIGIPADVAASDLPPGGLADLNVGDRVEISCSILDDGSWSARKVRLDGLKKSDKVKGVVTAVDIDGVSPDSLGISGITILIAEPGRSPDPRVELTRISLATRMTLLAQDAVLAARRVLDGRDGALVTMDGEVADAQSALLDNTADLFQAVTVARENQVGADRLGLDTALWLDPMSGYVAELDVLAHRFVAMAAADRAAARHLLEDELEPLLVDRIRPLTHLYILDAEEALARDVDHLSSQADRTARALVFASALALFSALALGRGVWQSLSRPLQDLAGAAAAIGRGRLDTRVPVKSNDELGLLAETLNRMAADLAATTVSISNLDDIFESMAGALFVLDEKGCITSANRAAVGLVGVSAAELRGRKLAEVCHPDPGVSLMPEPERTNSGVGHLHSADGGRVPVSFSGASLQRGKGPARGFVWIAQDLSQRLAMEEKLRSSLAEKELLLREVHHRVKNNLQVISSLLEMQGDCIVDDQARAVYANSQARIRSMALIHQQLYGASTLDRIDFGAYLEQLAESLFQFHDGGPGPVQILAEADPVSLGIDRALTCGLIVNELVTNALKHAFDPGQPGVVNISFRGRDEAYRLMVSDNGSGLGSSAASSDSLGMSLVEALVDQLAGSMEVGGEGGTRFEIVFPREEAS